MMISSQCPTRQSCSCQMWKIKSSMEQLKIGTESTDKLVSAFFQWPRCTSVWLKKKKSVDGLAHKYIGHIPAQAMDGDVVSGVMTEVMGEVMSEVMGEVMNEVMGEVVDEVMATSMDGDMFT